jgi:hypothetical protein
VIRALGVALSSLVLAVRGAAQSTARLGTYERGVQYQVGLAGGSPFVGSDLDGRTGALRGLDVAALLRTPGPMRVRIDGWAIDRRAHATQNPYSFYQLRESTALAVVASGEFVIRLPQDVSIEPAIGIGVVPYAHGQFDRTSPGDGTATLTGQGMVWAAGLALRWRHLVIEQHLLGITGADGPLVNGANAPLAIGLRF